MHIGMGLVCGGKIKDMTDQGFDFTIFLADWHSWINNKLGGDIERIRIVGEYFKHCFTALGIPSSKVKYVWASELASDTSYWEMVIRIAKSATVSRIQRTLPIMGRSISSTEVEAAALIYPCMQVADIYHMNIDVACAGIDQRKAHMLSREIASKFGYKKPISLHTPLLTGLEQTGQNEKFDEDARLSLKIGSKMSKSMPSRCIYIHDTPIQIKDKLNSAYCPPKEVENNPVMDIAEHVIFPHTGSLYLDRPEKYGGPTTFHSYQKLADEYYKGEIHPQDLKKNVSAALSNILEKVRAYFKDHKEPLDKVMEFETSQ